ncbi:RNA-splicing ligase RtcB [Enhygromyxa salina]|uniref:tRNA-splicing ligase RtcB n=1 Tax=Enhygromyxa salina TaxID=215803 RepID=A0A2S9XIB8_9BACT|nr:RNA-splicing ligase RtcB [Enhygromyxa salina]
MDLSALDRVTDLIWRRPATGPMKVPVVLYGDEALVGEMDDKVLDQATNVATLPGIVGAVYVMPDGRWGYGAPVGGVAAFDAQAGGVVSPGGVGFDISCGVRCLRTGGGVERVKAAQYPLADALFHRILAGVGCTGRIDLDDRQMKAMLRGGARWAVEQGWGRIEDLDRIEEYGCMAGARPEHVSARAQSRQRSELGTLGSGNLYLEVQRVAEIFAPELAAAFGLVVDQVVVSIHCGSRGLGHQIGTDYLGEMVRAAEGYGLDLPDKELACAPIASALGQRYLGAMRAGINCALANRQIITHLIRRVFADVVPGAELELIYDVSHNTCKEEEHVIDGARRRLFVHRKGATRAFGPGHPELTESLRELGQPVFIAGTMGTESQVLVGTSDSMALSFGSACHGAARRVSRAQATRRWQGRELADELVERGILIKAVGPRGVAEEAPGAYRDLGGVIDAVDHVGLARKVARLEPLICIKG